jgi:hypothetical protein
VSPLANLPCSDFIRPEQQRIRTRAIVTELHQKRIPGHPPILLSIIVFDSFTEQYGAPARIGCRDIVPPLKMMDHDITVSDRTIVLPVMHQGITRQYVFRLLQPYVTVKYRLLLIQPVCAHLTGKYRHAVTHASACRKLGPFVIHKVANRRRPKDDLTVRELNFSVSLSDLRPLIVQYPSRPQRISPVDDPNGTGKPNAVGIYELKHAIRLKQCRILFEPNITLERSNPMTLPRKSRGRVSVKDFDQTCSGRIRGRPFLRIRGHYGY